MPEPIDDAALTAYALGALEGEARAAVEALLATNEDAGDRQRRRDYFRLWRGAMMRVRCRAGQFFSMRWNSPISIPPTRGHPWVRPL